MYKQSLSSINMRLAELENERQCLQQELDRRTTWHESDIVPGMVVEALGHSRIVVLQWSYTTNRTLKYGFGGLNHNPLGLFSSFYGSKGGTAQEVADYFNEHQFTLIGKLETNFKKL